MFSKNLFGANFLHPYHSDQLYSGHSLAKGTFHETRMVTCYMKGCSNQSRLNKNVSYHKIPGQERKDIKKAWTRAIARPKAVHVCSDHFTEDSFDENQEITWHLLGGNLKYILKPDAVPPLFPNGKAVKKSWPSSVHLQQAFRKQKHLIKKLSWTKFQAAGFNTNSSKMKFKLF